MFRDTISYRQSNSDAHRVRSTNIRPPAMTWHMAFWLPKLLNEDRVIYKTFQKSKNRAEVQNKLDNIIISIAKSLRYTNNDHSIVIKPTVGNTSILFNCYVDSKTLEKKSQYFEENEASYILKDIKNNDRRVIILEFLWKEYFITIKCELQTEYFTITVIVEAAKDAYAESKLEDAVEFFARILDCYQPKGISLEDLYELFWSDFKSFIYGLDGVEPLMDERLFGEVFVDFRGFITNDRSPVVHENMCKTTEWAINSIGRYRADVTKKKEEISSSRAYECTASYMLNQNIVYMTALGPQDPNREPGTRNPVTFVIFVRNDPSSRRPYVNKWQLGRLVDRIHLLGRVRLAALRNLRLLRAVSVELSRIDGYVSDAQDAIQKVRSERKLDAQCTKTITEARLKLNEISQLFQKDEENTSRSGISYRVERSRYYVSLFNSNLPRVRLDRIEGYQPYDHFVERRQGSSFDTVDRIGIRYERAMRAITTIEQNYLAALSHKTNEDVKHIQRLGELFLIFFLIPYYVLGIFKYLVEFRIEYEDPMETAGRAILILFYLAGVSMYYRSIKKVTLRSFIVPIIGAIILAGLISSAQIQTKKSKKKDADGSGQKEQVYPKPPVVP